MPVKRLVVVTVGSGERPGADKWGDGIWDSEEWAVGDEFNSHLCSYSIPTYIAYLFITPGRTAVQ